MEISISTTCTYLPYLPWSSSSSLIRTDEFLSHITPRERQEWIGDDPCGPFHLAILEMPYIQSKSPAMHLAAFIDQSQPFLFPSANPASPFHLCRRRRDKVPRDEKVPTGLLFCLPLSSQESARSCFSADAREMRSRDCLSCRKKGGLKFSR